MKHDHDDDTLLGIFVLGMDEQGIPHYDQNLVQECCDYIYAGLGIKALAQRIGVSERGMVTFLECHPRIGRALRSAQDKFEIEIASDVRQQSRDGNFNASKFLLINRGTDWTDRPLPVIEEEEEAPKLEIFFPSES